MSAVSVTNVTVFDNPAPFLNPFQFEISYECHFPLAEDLEWKLVYIGSAEDEKYDQVLESVLVGPVNIGSYRFVFQADPPDASKIPDDDILGVTVMLLTCSYKGQEFVRIGYYVNNDYIDEKLREEPPMGKVPLTEVQRSILADKPRVTKFPITTFHKENHQNDVQNGSVDDVIIQLHQEERQGKETKEKEEEKKDEDEAKVYETEDALTVESLPFKRAKKEDSLPEESPLLKNDASSHYRGGPEEGHGLEEACLISSISS